MAKLKLLNTIFSKLGSLTKNNGQIIVTRDSKSLYVDLEGERIEITDWIDIDTEESLLAILTPLINKYYYTKDTNKIWRYIGGEWKCLNDSADDLAPTYTESSTLLKLSSGEKLSVAFGKISKAITDLISHIGDSVKHITSTERTNWNAAKTHADSTHARTDATKVEKSSTNGNIKINGTETTVYTHPSGTNPHGTTKSDVGLGNVGNYKAVSTVASQGLSDTEKSNARANIGAGTSSFSGSYNDLTNKPTIPSVGNGTITIKQAGTSKGTFTMNQSGNTTIELTDNNTTYGVATSSALGLVKSGTDITVDSSGNVSVNDDSHNHIISNVDGLQSALDGKAASSHTHDDKVDKWATAPTDLNNAITPGCYRVNSGHANIPNSSDWGQLLVIRGGADTITQIYGDYASGKLFTRSGNPSTVGGNGGWRGWHELISSNTIGSQSVNYANSAGSVAWNNVSGKPTSLPANGGNADTVDGHHFNWSGQSGQPTWVWGGNDSSNMYVYNPSNFNVNSSGIVRGSYTGNGGQQNPNYFGMNKVGFLMMNTTVNGDNHYKDWIIMDCYSGSDVGGATAIGVDRQEMRAFIMGSDANRTSWSRSAELITTSNIGSQSVNYANSAGSVAWGNVTNKPSTFTPASHTHNYAGSSSAGGSANSLSYFKNTSTTNVGIDDTSANAIGYVSDTGSILGQNDGALYRQAYSTSWAHEIYGDYITGQIAVRSKNKGTWQAWRKILDSSNYKSYCTPANIGAATASHTHSNYLTSITKDMVTTALGYTPPTKDTNTWRPLGTTADTACAGNDSRLSNARPASDVYAWAKASSKPSYSWSEITNKPSSFAPASHNHELIIDSNDKETPIYITYSKDELAYDGFTYLTAWYGYELRKIPKTLFATASHTHSYLPLSGGTVSGTITANNLQSKNGLTLTNTYSTADASIKCYWKDNSLHEIVTRNSNGLSSYFGWAGSSSYSTTTWLRGQTCKYQNASGTATLSDVRMKKDFRDLDVYDKFFDAIEPCAFRMINGSSGRYHIGYKAQQIEQALIDSGLTTQDFAGFIRMPYTIDKEDKSGTKAHEEAGIKEGDDELSIIYTEFAAMNTYQIQKCKNEISNLKNEIAELKNIISKLNA